MPSLGEYSSTLRSMCLSTSSPSLGRRQVGLAYVEAEHLTPLLRAWAARGASLRIGEAGMSRPLVEIDGIW